MKNQMPEIIYKAPNLCNTIADLAKIAYTSACLQH